MEEVLASGSSGGVAGSAEDDSKVEVPPPPAVVVAAAGRAEIDTSAPFESVKGAVDRFGGSAVWRTQLKQLFHPEINHCFEDADVPKLKEHAAQLKKDLIVKERVTLEVLKELEFTKKIANGLKLRIKEETLLPATNSDKMKVYPIPEAKKKGCKDPEKIVYMDVQSVESNQSAGLILMELKQTTVNLNHATKNLADIKALIELLNIDLQDERSLLEKTREKLTCNTAAVTSLEEEVNQTTKLQTIGYLEGKRCQDPSMTSKEIKQKNFEIEWSRKMTETAKDEVTRLTSEIDQTKASIKTAEIRWLAAKKMEEAARAAEDVALAEIKALLSSNNSFTDPQSISEVNLLVEEYTDLLRKAQEADEISRRKIEVAMQEVDEANRSKAEAVLKMEEATAKMKACKKALEDTLTRVDNANRGKLAVEEALRRWRSEHGQKRRSANNPTKFKNSASHHRRNSRMLNMNGSTLLSDVPTIDLSPPMSIGQILSMKLMVPVDYNDIGVLEKENAKPKVSLGELLGKKDGFFSAQQTREDDGSAKEQSSASKRKKLRFVGFSILLTKQSRKNRKKRQSSDTR